MEIFILLEFIVLAIVFVAIVVENKKLFDDLMESDKNLEYERRSKKILRDFIKELKEGGNE